MRPRVDGMRALAAGAPGAVRAPPDSLVLAGRKTATTGLMAEYAEEAEGLEYVGERLALLDDDGRRVATLDVTGVTRCSFADVPWEHALAEGEGDASLDEWRAGHRRLWPGAGATVGDGTPVVCRAGRVVALRRRRPLGARPRGGRGRCLPGRVAGRPPPLLAGRGRDRGRRHPGRVHHVPRGGALVTVR